MGTVTLPNTSKTTTDANLFANVKDNDQAIIDQINGNIDNTNVKSSAGISYSKLATLNTGQLVLGNAGTPTATTLTNATLGATGALTAVTDTALASPNNSVYRTVASTHLASAAGITSGAVPGVLATATAWGTGGIGTSGLGYGLFNFGSSDYAVAGLTTKFRVQMEVSVGATSPSTVTFNGGLYPLTVSGGALNPGTVVTGSTTGTSPTPSLATNTLSRYTSSDFAASALLSDPGTYVLGFVVGSITVPTAIGVTMRLQQRNT